MKASRAIPALIAVCWAASGILSAEPAETVFINGNIHTVNDRQPQAEAIAVKGGRIVFVGSNAEAAEKFPAASGSRRIDLQGRTVVPGMTDAHCHIFGIGAREMNLNLEGTASLEDFLAKVKERVRQTPPGHWVTGRGWIETFWKPQIFPTRLDLDKVSPDNPVFLTRADGHGVVVNSAALKIAGITKDTPNPFGGEILKDKKSGEPLGMLAGSRRGPGRQAYPTADCGGNGARALARRETQPRARVVRNPKRREAFSRKPISSAGFAMRGKSN